MRGGFGIAFRSVACDTACPSASSCPHRNACIYAGIFEPRAVEGPSGLVDQPRPFVFRARHLDGRRISPGENFSFDAHLFDTSPKTVLYFISAFRTLAESGIGPRRGSAELRSVTRLTEQGVPGEIVFSGGTVIASASAEPIKLSLAPTGLPVSKVSIRFVSPTELSKHERLTSTPEFGFLFARLRDRISNLRAAYGGGSLEIDFREMGKRARKVQITRSSLKTATIERLSSKTSRRHSIGGFVGNADYCGELTEFIPYLKAGFWTGVGRHAVWGNGEIEVVEG